MINSISCLFSIFCTATLVCLAACNSQPPGAESVEKLIGKGNYVGGEMSLQHGMQLFNQHCASCHNFSENGIGPNLAGVTTRVNKEWLISFIHNPSELIESGDARAVALFEKYNQYMPSFPMIAGEDLEDILGFIHKFSEGEKRNKNNRPGGLINPIPEKISSSGFCLIVEEQFKVPPSSEVRRSCRNFTKIY
jgi:mono/diheme cytochrome c family protein